MAIRRNAGVRQVRRELLREDKRLGELVRTTRELIGSVAVKGFDEFASRAAAGFDSPGYSNRSPANHHVQSPVLLPGNAHRYLVTNVATSWENGEPGPSGRRGPHKAVTVNLRIPAADPMYELVSEPYAAGFLTVVANGVARYNGTYTFGRPWQRIIPPYAEALQSSIYLTSPEALRDGYAASFSAALAVASSVAAGLEAAYDIHAAAPRKFISVLDAWREVSTNGRVELYDPLPRFLPGPIAEHLNVGQKPSS